MHTTSTRLFFLSSLLLLCLLLSFTSAASPLPYPSPSLPFIVYLYHTDSLSADDQFLLLTLQGALSKLAASGPTPSTLLYHVSGSPMSTPEHVYWAEYQHRYNKSVTFDSTSLNGQSVANIIKMFSSQLTGYYLCTLQTDSVNIAVSLAGITPGAIVSTQIHQPFLHQLDLPLIQDVRGMTEPVFIQQYLNGSSAWPFSTRFLTSQLMDKTLTSLTDFSMLLGAIQIQYEDSYNSLISFLHTIHPPTQFNAVFGWIPPSDDEHTYTQTASAAGAGVLASDWLNNGATHIFFQATSQQPIVNPTKGQPGHLPNNTNKHTVAVLFTDGDNICSDMNLLLDNSHWNNSQRGKIPIGWGINPSLSSIAPIGLQTYYKQASARDGFVGFSAQYAYPDYMPGNSRQQWSEITAAMMQQADLRIVNYIGDSFNTSYFTPLLNEFNVDGVIYFNYYNNYVLPDNPGQVIWVNDKPAISVRSSLWQGHSTPQSMAALLNKQSPDHTVVDGYSVIAVHIWSEGVDDLITMASLLHPDVLLVKPDELVMLMTQNTKHT